MKKILCFGDSNTYGFNPEDGSRYAKNVRWSGVLSTLLKNRFKIIEKGLNNRNCFVENAMGKDYTGAKILPEYLKDSLDCIIFALGINDLQLFYNPSTEAFKTGLKDTLSLIDTKNIKTILVCPAKLSNDILHGNFSNQFDKNSVLKSLQLPEIYKTVAKNLSCDFLDLNEIIEVSPIDGLHYSPYSHKLIARTLYKRIVGFFPD